MIKERKENLISSIRKSLEIKNNTISRRIITELSTYICKSRDLKYSNENVKFYSPIYTVKTLENSSLNTQANIIKNIKQNSFKIKDNSRKIVNTHDSPKKETFLLTENNFKIYRNKIEPITRNKMTSTDSKDTKLSIKNIPYYHKLNRKSKDKIAFLNLNHFVDKCEEGKANVKRPYSSSVNIIKNNFNKMKQLIVKSKSSSSPKIFDSDFPKEQLIHVFKRGFLVSRPKSKYFKSVK